jgi:hypothetical protein
MTRARLLDRIRVALAGSLAVQTVLGEQTNFAAAGAARRRARGRVEPLPRAQPGAARARLPSSHHACPLRVKGGAVRLFLCGPGASESAPPLRCPPPADIKRATRMAEKFVFYYGFSSLGITTWANQP